MRHAREDRNTKETKITCDLNLDGTGLADIATGIGFFDHMLNLFTFHSNIDLTMQANGDLDVCDHHTVEDCGIILGSCIKKALGDKKGIERYGSMNLPMDETLCNVTLDISGRAFLVYHCELKRDTVGTFSCEMVEEFFRAVAFGAGITLHMNIYYGSNDHHKIEALFKAFGRSLRQAITITSDILPSTKGTL